MFLFNIQFLLGKSKLVIHFIKKAVNECHA